MRSISMSIMTLVLLGCTSKTGSLTLEQTTPVTLDAVIKKHVTTATDIRNYLGNPVKIEFTPTGNEVWTYIFRRTDVKARTFVPIANLFSSEIDTSEKILVITFNTYKQVSHYTVSENFQRNKAGILESYQRKFD